MSDHLLLNIYSTNLLQPLLNGTFLPITNASMSPANLLCILNDVATNGRRCIIEFGSGISTVLIGRLIRKNNLPSKLISIEHDRKWISVVQPILEKDELDKVVTLIHAPLVPCEIAVDKNLWYNKAVLDRKLPKKVAFDLVIIDGPPAFDPAKIRSRYPAFPYLQRRLAKHAAVYLDDAERAGEKWVVEKWEQEFNIKFTKIYGTLGYYSKGVSFSSEVVKLSFLR